MKNTNVVDFETRLSVSEMPDMCEIYYRLVQEIAKDEEMEKAQQRALYTPSMYIEHHHPIRVAPEGSPMWYLQNGDIERAERTRAYSTYNGLPIKVMNGGKAHE